MASALRDMALAQGGLASLFKKLLVREERQWTLKQQWGRPGPL